MKDKVFKRIEAIKKAMKNDKGFTLVELIVTVTIIGILSAVVTTGVSGAASTSQTKANQALFNSVQSGLDTYAASTPTVSGVPVLLAGAGTEVNYFAADGVPNPTLNTGPNPTTADFFINFASTSNSFNTFFRLNNSASVSFKCIVTGGTANTVSTTFTLKSCHN